MRRFLAAGMFVLAPACSYAWEGIHGDLIEHSSEPVARVESVEDRWLSLRRMLVEGELPRADEPARPLSIDERTARNRELREAMRSAYGERPGGVMRSGFPQR
ncbi:MAG: hypothetical protein KJZ96_03445 [Rhodocyclaceae bacterium]|jgi:hypothetical protein|nr:hypothetical protein [Rhodocyclaceae bacterium]MCL4757380.1 hypothetical protein [Rhodocyclaceae bacterium]